MSTTTALHIQENYTFKAMIDRVKRALETAGFGSGPVQWSDLVPFDQFHVRGLEATKEMAESLKLKGNEKILDVGSGLGGPARYLAAVHGVHVTGIDLTPDYIEISDYLSARAGLADKLEFNQGDATNLPYPAEQFDIAWTQHVAMNIENKVELYKGIHHLLKKDGRIAIYDAIKGDNQPVIYPTPWARDAAISFIPTESEMNDALASAGFKILSSVDQTEISAQWFRKLQQQQPTLQTPNPLSPFVIFGPEVALGVANFGKNLLEGRVRIVQVIAEKA